MEIGLSARQLAKLHPAEELAFKMAAQMVAEERNPGLNVTAELVLTIERLLRKYPLDQINEEEK